MLSERRCQSLDSLRPLQARCSTLIFYLLVVPFILQLHKGINAATMSPHGELLEQWFSHRRYYPLTNKELDYLTQKAQFQPRSSQKPCIRQEYRTLTDDARRRFHEAIKKMKTSVIDPEMRTNRYDVFTRQHRLLSAPGAHGGPCFLIYHRMLLYRFEQALREIDSTVCLPYWDSTLDSRLPNPSHAILWTPEYLGTSYGLVEDGPCAGWRAVPEECEQVNPRLYREMIGDPGLMMTENKINQFMNKHSFREAVAPTNTHFEDSHGDMHICMGGHMNDLMCSPNDLVFYLHHCFVDLIWEDFRKTHPGSPYPYFDIDYNRPMDPVYPWYEYRIQEIYDSENFTKNYYHYQIRPGFCMKDTHCCPPYGGLYCDFKEKRCRTKVRRGGECSGLGDAACYCDQVGQTGSCQNGFCQCVNGCKQDAHCIEGEWCDTSRWRCTNKAGQGQQCSVSDIPNNACFGPCPSPSVPLCYQYKCHCAELNLT